MLGREVKHNFDGWVTQEGGAGLHGFENPDSPLTPNPGQPLYTKDSD